MAAHRRHRAQRQHDDDRRPSRRRRGTEPPAALAAPGASPAARPAPRPPRTRPSRRPSRGRAAPAGTTSAMIDSAIDVAGPPNAPAIARASTSDARPLRERARRGADHQAEQRHAQRLAPVETIEEARADDPRDRRRRRVAARDQPEVRRSRCRAPRAKSGPSGITIMKSRMLTNWTAPTRKTIRRSEAATGRRARCRGRHAQPFRLRSRRARNSSNVAQRRYGLLRVSWPIVDVGVSP